MKRTDHVHTTECSYPCPIQIPLKNLGPDLPNGCYSFDRVLEESGYTREYLSKYSDLIEAA